MFRAALCLLVLPVGLIGASGVIVLLARVRAPRRLLDAVYIGFGHFCAWIGGTEIEVEGREHIDPACAYVVVANHESNWDPVVLLAAISELSLRFVVKDALVRVPVFGRALTISGNIRVVRNNTAGDVREIRQHMQERPKGVSMIFYAEGGRAREGEFRRFKRGAFATAIGYQLPILPIAIGGTFAIWKPDSLRVRKGTAVLSIGKPIPVAGMRYDDRNRLLEETQAAVSELRNHARQRLREQGQEPGGRD